MKMEKLTLSIWMLFRLIAWSMFERVRGSIDQTEI